MNRRYVPGLADDVSKLRVFSTYEPKVHAGDAFTVRVEQQAKVESGSKKGWGVSTANDGMRVHFKAEGPHERLAETEVVGRYPAAGSDNSPDEFMCHVALTRRSLPWERIGVALGGTKVSPWLVLLVLKRSELHRGTGTSPFQAAQVGSLKTGHLDFYNKLKSCKYADDTQLDIAWVEKRLLQKVLPLKSELELLCHVQQLQLEQGAELSEDDPHFDQMWKLDDDCCVSVVMGNRLPDAGTKGEPQEHVACLVSIERRDDLPFPEPGSRSEYKPPAVARQAPAATLSAGGAGTISAGPVGPAVEIGDVVRQPLDLRPLVVLHSWTFKPSRGGDFEQVVKMIRYAPHGGVLRFGMLPRTATSQITTLTADGYLTLQHGPDGGQGLYRGPLTPNEVPRQAAIALRAAPAELSDPAHKGKLDYSYASAFEIGRLLTLADDGLLADLQGVRQVIQLPRIPQYLAIDPRPKALAKKDWVVDPADMGEKISLPEAPADYAGIAELKAQVNVQQVVSQLDAIRVGAGRIDTQIDIDTVGGAELDAQFAAVVTHGQAGGGG